MNTQTYLLKRQRLEATARDAMGSHHTAWPDVRELAKRLRVRQQDILDMTEDSEVLDLCVGVQIPGAGHASFSRIGDYQVEWVGEGE